MPASVIGYEASNSIVELNTTELDKLSYYVLEFMINSGDFASTLTANTASTGNLIGTFVDTVRAGDIGDSNITILSNSTNLYQSNTRSHPTVPTSMTVGLNTAATGSVVLQENKTPLSALGQEIFSRYMSNGPGTYFLGVTAPIDGGTWAYDYYIDDTLFNFTIQNARYYLWKKIDQNYTGAHIEPLKLSSNVLTRFSDAEIKQLAYYVEDTFLTTDIGQYVLQTSPPATGVWVNQGTITDIRRLTEDAEFSGSLYAGDYIGTYQGADAVAYLSPAALFAGYTGEADFINPDELTFSVSYTGNFTGTSPTGGNYTGTVTYDGTVTYTGTVTYVGPINPANPGFTGFVGSGNFSGTVGFAGSATFVGPGPASYVENSIVDYLGPGGAYTGDGPSYQGIAVLLADYDGLVPATYEGVGFVGYIFPYLANYDTPYDTDYTATFTSDFNDLLALYSGEFASNFVGLFDGTSFEGFNTFSNPDEVDFTVTYTGNFARAFAGYTRNYVENQVLSYLGPGPGYTSAIGYLATFEGTYEGNFVSIYAGTYIGDYDIDYTTTYLGTFIGQNYQANYEGVGFTNFFGTAPVLYEGDAQAEYTGLGSGFAVFESDFVTQYQSTYIGSAVSSSEETVSSLTLWRRIE
jgi:hypothetical protein